MFSRCAFDDGSGTVSLKGIRLNADGTPEFSVYDGDYTYLYNPCKGFDYLDKSDLAVGIVKHIILFKSFIIHYYTIRVKDLIIWTKVI